jgi:hypothetical protein
MSVRQPPNLVPENNERHNAIFFFFYGERRHACGLDAQHPH